jgi:hypothetical protein
MISASAAGSRQRTAGSIAAATELLTGTHAA